MVRKLRPLFVVFLVVLFFSNSISAASVKSFTMTYEVDNQIAREMLPMINEWRTGGEAWYWNENNTKYNCGKLSAYTYDYNLEQIALQRAYEAAVSFEHTRPNGQDCFTCTYNGTSTHGECIAIGGLTTAESAYELWQENDEDYDGQGHRRLMLSSSYKCIGIAHVVLDSVHVWVQEYGWTNSGASATTAIVGTRNGTVAVDVSSFEFYLNPETNISNMLYSNTQTLPALKAYYRKPGSTWTYGAQVPSSALSNITWKSSNTSAVVVENNKTLRAVAPGDSKITASVTYEGKTYTYEKSITVSRVALSNTGITATVPNCTFNLNGNTPKPVIKFKDTTLVEGTDYDITSYSYNTSVTSNANVKVTGKGNYSGTRTIYFQITACDINDVTLASIPSVSYTGNAAVPEVTLTQNGKTLTKGTHYTISCTDSQPGTATVTITGKGNFTGTRTATFTISKQSAANLTVNTISDQQYTGNAITPNITVKNGSKTLVKDTDYSVTYKNNTEPGTASVTITGIGNYTGTKTVNFNIVPKQMSGLTCSYTRSFYYTGSRITTTVTVKNGSATLTEGTDYTVSYSNNTNVGTATITLTGKGKYYAGTRDLTFEIKPVTVSMSTFTVSETYTYTGSAIVPSFTLKYGDVTFKQGVDYTVTYSNNVEPGSGEANITGISSILTGSAVKKFTINRISISNVTVADIPAQIYTGSAIEPAVTVKDGSKTLVRDTDYTLSFYGNTSVTSSARVTVTGINHYTGTRYVYFSIVQKSIANATISSIADQAYTGSAIKPAVTVKDGTKTLVSGTDYTVSYANNVNIGTATVTVTGKGSYTGTKTATFNITGKTISSATVSSIANQVYTGSSIKPSVTVKYNGTALTLNTDYTVAYTNNVNAGTATVTITGKGGYSGTKTASFKILPDSCELTVQSIGDKTYTGSAITPSVAVKAGSRTLVSGTDYTCAYSNNINAGTATVTVTGKGNYSGTGTAKFTIAPKAISNFTISSIEDQTYTGSPITPSVTVKDGTKTLTQGTDYTVNYTDNVNAGTATVTITGIGNYSRTRSVTFTIVKASTPDPDKPDYSWEKRNGYWYLFDKNGNMVTGFATVDGATYYMDSNGKMLTGWVEISGFWYYFEGSGAMKTGWKQIGGSWYYLDPDGKMLKDWQKIGGVWYFLGQSGIMRTGWQQIGNVTYYFTSSGAMATGWKQIDGSWYYFEGSGAMKTGWLYAGGKWYYLNSNGTMATGWVLSGGKWYRFGSDGAMLFSTSVEIGGKVYSFDENGVCTNP